MTRLPTQRWLAGILASGLWVGASVAEEQEPLPAESRPELEAALPQLTPSQMSAQSVQILTFITKVKAQLSAMLDQARSQKDVVKTLCLDDKFGQVGTALDTAQDRSSALTEALSSSALQRARHEFSLLDVLKESVAALSEEAGLCIGEEVNFASEEQESELEVVVDNILPDTDPNVIQLAPVISIPPSVSSPAD